MSINVKQTFGKLVPARLSQLRFQRLIRVRDGNRKGNEMAPVKAANGMAQFQYTAQHF